MSTPGNGTTRPRYDYVLVAGPGRSGSTFLYRLLTAHPAFAAPHIKEGHYYRSARRFERARRRLRGSGAMLLDVANTAWSDVRLERVAALVPRGGVLMVVLLRRHRDRAVSVMAFRRSRVLPGVWAGRRGSAEAAARESLTVAALERLFGLGPDVLAVRFETLVNEPQVVLDALARLCNVQPLAAPPLGPVNVSVRARHPLLTGAGKLAAMALRRAGARRLLQALKDEPRVVGLFFRPEHPERRPRLSETEGRRLDQHFEACLAAVDAAGERLHDGLWFVAADTAQRKSDGASG